MSMCRPDAVQMALFSRPLSSHVPLSACVTVAFFSPPYGSMGVFSLLYVCFFVRFFVCMYGYGFLSCGKEDRGVKFCTHIRLLSGMSFSHFGELWLVGSHGGGITSGMYADTNWMQAAAPGEARSRWDSELGACRANIIALLSSR